MQGNFSTFPNQLIIFFIHKFLDVLLVLGLAGNSSKCLMSHNIILFIVLDAFSDHALILIAADLSNNEADFVLEQTCLSF